MTLIDYAHAQPYIDAGARVDGKYVIGSRAVIESVVVGIIGSQVPITHKFQVFRADLMIAEVVRYEEASALLAEDKTLRVVHVDKRDWNDPSPSRIIADAGWGTNREKELVGANYEMQRTLTLVRARYAPASLSNTAP